MREFGVAPAIAVPFDRNNFRVVREAVDEGDGAGRVGEDGVPLLEGQIRRDEEGFLLVATTHDLKEEIGGVGVVGQVANFINGEQVGPGVGNVTFAGSPARAGMHRSRGERLPS